eukprot:135048-Pyramimonas_sp.AAC.1
MRVPFVADRPGVPNGDCAGGVATGAMPLGARMPCEGLPGICSNRADSPKMRPNVCGSPCGSGMSLLSPLTG